MPEPILDPALQRVAIAITEIRDNHLTVVFEGGDQARVGFDQLRTMGLPPYWFCSEELLEWLQERGKTDKTFGDLVPIFDPDILAVAGVATHPAADVKAAEGRLAVLTVAAGKNEAAHAAQLKATEAEVAAAKAAEAKLVKDKATADKVAETKVIEKVKTDSAEAKVDKAKAPEAKI